MGQYDGIVIKSGIPTIIGVDTLRADRGAHAGLTTTGLASGDVVQVSGALTLQKAVNTSTSPIIGVYDGVSGSVVREGVVVATFSDSVPVAGSAVYLSATAGQLTGTKPTMDMLHEVGVVMDASTSKVLLQQKPVISLQASAAFWLANNIAPKTYDAASVAYLGACDYNNASQTVLWDGQYIWSAGSQNEAQVIKINPVTRLKVAGPFTIGVIYNTPGLRGMAFDGTNYWILYSNQIKKFNSAGTVLTTISTGPIDYFPYVISAGPGYILVAGQDWRISKINTTSNSVVGTYSDVNYRGMGTGIFDGTYFWQSWWRATGGGALYLMKLRVSDMALLAAYDLSFTQYNMYERTAPVAFDGVYLWVACCYWGPPYVNPAASLKKVRASDGVVVATYGPWPDKIYAICYDGTSILMGSTTTIWQIRPADGAILGTWAVPCYGICDNKHVLPWPVV